MVTVDISAATVQFWQGDVEIGRYILDDPFKPYLHPLKTVEGDVASLAIAHDHRHHKGLMFALQTDKGNFWEETPRDTAPIVGRQISDGVTPLPIEVGAGFREELTWQADGKIIFTEVRTILSKVTSGTVTWQWDTHLRAQTPVVLEQSEWSAPDSSGNFVNYHGLGLRFPRALEVAGEATLAVVDGMPTQPALALGSTAHEVGLRGPIDGSWPPRHIDVRFRQVDRKDAFFISRAPLAYLSLGPSNASAFRMDSGDVLDARYEIDVRSGPLTP